MVKKVVGDDEQKGDPPLPVDVVMRALRSMREPITMFGETPWERYNRYKKLEIERPEETGGAVDDFGETMRALDDADNLKLAFKQLAKDNDDDDNEDNNKAAHSNNNNGNSNNGSSKAGASTYLNNSSSRSFARFCWLFHFTYECNVQVSDHRVAAPISLSDIDGEPDVKLKSTFSLQVFKVGRGGLRCALINRRHVFNVAIAE
jgi:hypothetical protein